MRYGVFRLDNENKLMLVTRYDTIEEAQRHAQAGVNMIILEFYS
nr:hypothetical protein [uncultured Carboxylicivirga sp.]